MAEWARSPRLPGIVDPPEGLLYQPDFLTADEERDLVAQVEQLSFDEVRMRGQTAKRTVAHFGYRYQYESSELVPVEPWPASWAWVRQRAGALADVDPERFVEALVTRYPPGAGIGWHRDAPRFGSKVVGVSLLSACPMRFQRGVAGARTTYALELEPRSAYVLSGPVRWAWQHSIPAARDLRYSITFRTLNPGRA